MLVEASGVTTAVVARVIAAAAVGRSVYFNLCHPPPLPLGCSCPPPPSYYRPLIATHWPRLSNSPFLNTAVLSNTANCHLNVLNCTVQCKHGRHTLVVPTLKFFTEYSNIIQFPIGIAFVIQYGRVSLVVLAWPKLPVVLIGANSFPGNSMGKSVGQSVA